jgi:ferredoxin-NADP reductase
MSETIEWHNARLRAMRDLSPDIRLFEIEPVGEFVSPTPGSHFNIVVHINGRPDVRTYSAISLGTDGVYRIAVKRLPNSRGGSAYMWTLAPGAQLTMSTPGNHELGRGRPDCLLLAGGIGITPIFTMTMALAETGANFRLLYAARCRRDLALADELWNRIGDRLQVFLSDEGRRLRRNLLVCSRTGSSTSVARSACWRTPSANGSAAADQSISCGSRRLVIAVALRPSRSK